MQRHTIGYYTDTCMQVTDIKQGNGKRKLRQVVRWSCNEIFILSLSNVVVT